MVEGAVYGESDALVELAVLGPGGQRECLDFRVDTGFDGALTLPGAGSGALVPDTRTRLVHGSRTRCPDRPIRNNRGAAG